MGNPHLAQCKRRHRFVLKDVRSYNGLAHCPNCNRFVPYVNLGQTRTTFVSRDTLDVRMGTETLYYGPATAVAYREVSDRHLVILAERDRAVGQLRSILRWFRQTGYSTPDSIGEARKQYPELWAKVFPWRRLDREGFELIRLAALQDTEDYLENTDLQGDPLWDAMPTPKAAYERYGIAA